MGKYIDRAALFNSLTNAKTVAEVFAAIQDAPAADVQEIRRGKWLMTDGYPHKVYCSECYATLIPNVEWFKTYNIASNYCPNCGAAMKGQNDND